MTLLLKSLTDGNANILVALPYVSFFSEYNLLGTVSIGFKAQEEAFWVFEC